MVKIKNYEMVDPLDLVKGIDETIDILNKKDVEFDLNTSKELIINLLFISRNAIMFNVAITKKLNLKNLKGDIIGDIGDLL